MDVSFPHSGGMLRIQSGRPDGHDIHQPLHLLREGDGILHGPAIFYRIMAGDGHFDQEILSASLFDPTAQELRKTHPVLKAPAELIRADIGHGRQEPSRHGKTIAHMDIHAVKAAFPHVLHLRDIAVYGFIDHILGHFHKGL